MSARQPSLVKLEGTESVLIVGWVEDLSERAFPSKDRLTFFALDGEEYILVASSDVENLDTLSAKRITVLGNIDSGESPPLLTVLGYRIMPILDPENDSGGGSRRRPPMIRKKAA